MDLKTKTLYESNRAFLHCNDCNKAIEETNFLFYIEYIAGGNQTICPNCIWKNRYPIKSMTIFTQCKNEGKVSLLTYEFFNADKIKLQALEEFSKDTVEFLTKKINQIKDKLSNAD